ncbi:histone-like nucleoid-structuring protein Lsr2 (plasmid) [Streptomyces sp. QH1-20]|uniref:Lsr2 family DNA-binding protein n=1 Tax=Streptomyces sp. QH1-20 TaxID=3240934 RepID=UPI0035120AC9
MFTDWTEALDAEALPLNPNPAQQLAAASRVTARRAHDQDDLAWLLDNLGLPTDEATLTSLIPLLPENGDAPAMTTTSPALSAHEAVAISMHNNGDSDEAVREATGLSEQELSDLIADQAPTPPNTPASSLAVPASAGIQELLAWAGSHTLAGIRSRAARITADLAELSDRRESEAAQHEAEERISKLKAELEQAQADLRTAKAGTRTSSTATSNAATPIRKSMGSGRTKEELAAVRSWARANGHQLADAGMVPKRILEAYDAAHQAPVSKAG